MKPIKNLPIMEATVRNNLKRLSQLLASGADPNAVEDHAGVTPLHHAAACGHYEAALLLLTAGAMLLKENFSNITPLDIARSRNDKRLVALFSCFYNDVTGNTH